MMYYPSSTTTTIVFAEVASAAREHSLGQRAVRTDRARNEGWTHTMERWSTQWHTNGSLSDRQRELPQLTDTATTARCSEYRSTDERGGSCGFCKYVQSLDASRRRFSSRTNGKGAREKTDASTRYKPPPCCSYFRYRVEGQRFNTTDDSARAVARHKSQRASPPPSTSLQRLGALYETLAGFRAYSRAILKVAGASHSGNTISGKSPPWAWAQKSCRSSCEVKNTRGHQAGSNDL